MATRGEGPSKIDGVEVGEFQVDFLSNPMPVLNAKFALVNVDESMRLGFSHSNAWSAETMEHLETLKKSMETDICRRYFGGTVSTSDGGTPQNEDDVAVVHGVRSL